jgi:DNA-binding CsgD family transcriptional regulator/tetratricopeptide (TPR) repeat protein
MRGVDRVPGLLVGRTAELDALEGALTAAVDGSGRIVLVEGAAGTGKSALVAAAHEQAQAHGVEVLVARGSQLEQAVPFGLAFELVGGDLPAAAAEELLVQRLFSFVANLAERSPRVVTVDDAHWSDVPSLRFLVYLAERIDRLPMTLVVTLDPGEAATGERPMGRLRSVPEARVLRIGPLSPAGVAALIRRRYFPDADDEFCRAVEDASGGNPFVVREVLRLADLEELPATAASAGRVREMLPDKVLRATRDRLARLGPEAERLAEAAAVLGPDALLRHASRLAGLDLAAAAHAADDLVATLIVAGLNPLRFTQPTLRSAVYRSIAPGRRSLLHQRAAAMLRDDGAEPERLAPHLMATVPAGNAEVTRTLRAAARSAMAGGDPMTALHYLRRALAEPAPASEARELLVELGRVEAMVGDPEAIEHLRRAVEVESTDQPARAEALYEAGRTLVGGGRPDEASEYLDLALVEAGPSDSSELHQRVLAAQLHTTRLRGRKDRRLIAAAEAAVARPGPARPGRKTLSPAAPVLVGQLAMEWLLGGRHSDEVRAVANRALAGMESATNAETGLLFYDAVAALAWADDLDAAAAILDRAVVRAERSGHVMDVVSARFRRAMVSYLRGSVAAAFDDAKQAVEGAPPGWAVHLPAARGILALALIELDELGWAADALVGGDPAEGQPATIPEAIWRVALGSLRLVEGDLAAAVEEGLAAGRILTDNLGSPTPLVPWRSLAATALHQLGDTVEARRLAAEEVEVARAFGAPRALGVALRTSGIVTGGAEGIALLRESVEVLEDAPARLQYAHSLGELGSALRRTGDREAADVMRRALELAERCGAVRLAAQLRDEIRVTGARLPRRSRVHAGTLTPAQERVARLAATGLTNKQIAGQLYVSVAAVEFHLRNVFRKLGISARGELPGALPPED